MRRRRTALEGAGSKTPRYWRDALTTGCVPVLLGCIMLAGCGGAAHDATVAAKAPGTDEAVGAKVKRHLEDLNPHQNAGIRSVSCEERGPVPSMGTNAVAFLCTIDANNGEATKPQLWAYLPQDKENHVELLDETAERELAARGEVPGLNDGHSEADNRSAEEDIHHAEEEVTQQSSAQATPPAVTTKATQGTNCGVLSYHSERWTLGERWTITDSGTSCPEAMQIIRDDFSRKGIKHVGSDNAETYTVINGWRCGGPETGGIGCTRGTQHITGSELRGATEDDGE
jgi:hypothetical protein